VKDLNESQDEEEMGRLSDNILQLLKQLPSPSITSSSTNQIYGSSITLWNKAVLLKPSSQVSLSLNAQLRHVALSLLLYSTTLDTSDTVIKKQIMMAIKTGRSWLESDNPMMAETSLELAKQCYNKLINDHPDVAKSPEYLKLHFKILCSQAEAVYHYYHSLYLFLFKSHLALNVMKKLLTTLKKLKRPCLLQIEKRWDICQCYVTIVD
jgi:hypothetical protein